MSLTRNISQSVVRVLKALETGYTYGIKRVRYPLVRPILHLPWRLLLALAVLVLTSLGLEGAIAYSLYQSVERADTLYRAARQADQASAFYNQRAAWAEGRLSQCQAQW